MSASLTILILGLSQTLLGGLKQIIQFSKYSGVLTSKNPLLAMPMFSIDFVSRNYPI